jgi:hypothetical protein
MAGLLAAPFASRSQNQLFGFDPVRRLEISRSCLLSCPCFVFARPKPRLILSPRHTWGVPMGAGAPDRVRGTATPPRYRSPAEWKDDTNVDDQF